MAESTRRMVMMLLLATLALGAYLLVEKFLIAPEPALPSAAVPEDGAEDGEDAADDVLDPAPSDPTEPGEGPQPEPEVEPAQRLAQQELFQIETDEYIATFSNLNTGLTSFLIKSERYGNRNRETGETSLHDMVTTDREQYLPLQLELGGVRVPASAVWEGEQLSPRSVRFTWSGARFRVVRKLQAGQGPYQVWSTVKVVNLSAEPQPFRLNLTAHHYVRREDEGGGFFFARPSPAASRGICNFADDTVRVDRSALEDGPQGYGPPVSFGGIESTYFAIVMASDGEPAASRCRVEGTMYTRNGEAYATLYESKLTYPRVELSPNEPVQYRTLIYAGPKDLEAIAKAAHNIPDVVDLGWFDFVARYMVALLAWIYGILGGHESGNWGIAIILLTILVKVLLYPLTEKSFRSMSKMRLLKPQLDRINEMYANDREKKTAATMELYRKEKINPIGGCLPMLAQMPIWFALYQSLSTNVELFHADFGLWLHDLSAPDPYYVLPLILGGLMFVQQRLNPTTMDAAQARIMMYVMPAMITVFMLFLPAGLCLYMVTNSVLGIAQQQLTNYRLEQAQAAAIATASETSDSDEAGSPTDGGDSPVVVKGKAQSAPSKRSRSKRRKTRGRA